MSVALAVPERSRDLAVVPARAPVGVVEWTAAQVRLIKDSLTSNLTDPEFALFAQVCHRTGLDPFTRQIYAIKRRQQQNGQWVERMTIQTGIDGYRVTAERTGEYVGGDAPRYGAACKCGDTRRGAHPLWASVTVRRIKDGEVFATAERADFHEYVVLNRDGSPQGLWAKMPKRMLAKCAEALALRRAFPSLLHGIYTAEEMAQADAPTVDAAQVVDATVVQNTNAPEPDTPTAPKPPGLLDGIDDPREPQVGDPCIACRRTGRLRSGARSLPRSLRITALSVPRS